MTRELIEAIENCPISDGCRMMPLDLAERIVVELHKFEDFVEIPYIDLADASAAKWIFGHRTMKENDDAAQPEKPA